MVFLSLFCPVNLECHANEKPQDVTQTAAGALVVPYKKLIYSKSQIG